jgi:hypothetical protein
MGYGLSQQEWSDHTGAGLASIKRWETGSQIQNEMADRFLALLLDRSIFEKLGRATKPIVPAEGRRFQTELPPQAREFAAKFVLRKAQG